jgi:hypothetical protein
VLFTSELCTCIFLLGSVTNYGGHGDIGSRTLLFAGRYEKKCKVMQMDLFYSFGFTKSILYFSYCCRHGLLVSILCGTVPILVIYLFSEAHLFSEVHSCYCGCYQLLLWNGLLVLVCY